MVHEQLQDQPKQAEGLPCLEHFLVNEVDSNGFPLTLTGICIDIDSYKSNSIITETVCKYDTSLGLQQSSRSIHYPDNNTELTQRELEIAKLICDGKSNEEIANDLFISYHTAKTHRKNIYEKTCCKNVTELYRFYQNCL